MIDISGCHDECPTLGDSLPDMGMCPNMVGAMFDIPPYFTIYGQNV